MSGRNPRKPAGGPHCGSLIRAVLGFAILCLLVGCTVTWGSPPRIDRLETLQRGVSRKADVLQALGEPRGKGVSRNADRKLREAWEHDVTREIWFYEFSKSGGGRTNSKILLVFFHKETYDGYLWYCSGLPLKAKQ